MRVVAGRGAVAKRHRENAGRRAVAKRLAALWRIAIRKMLPAGRCSAAKSHREDANQHRGATAIGSASEKRHREDADDRELHQGAAPESAIGKQHREATPPRKAAGKGAAAGFDF